MHSADTYDTSKCTVHIRIDNVDNVLSYMAVCQNLVPLVNIKIAGKWMFIPIKMVLIGIDPYPYIYCGLLTHQLGRDIVNSDGYLRTGSAHGHGWARVNSSEMSMYFCHPFGS